MVKLPTNINPAPLVEAVVEVRFLPSIPPAAIFGKVYDMIQKDYGDISSLPILQLTEEVLELDPNLSCQPHYRAGNTRFLLQFGPRIFNVAVLDKNYPGWSLFRDEILRLFDIFIESGVIDSVIRVGIRYINYFSFNVFEVSNFSICLEEKSLINEKTLLRVEFSNDHLITSLQVSNGVQINIGTEIKQGSIIDLDTFCGKPNLAGNKSQDFRNLIEDAHQALKRRFFSSLRETYVTSLNPQYE